VFEAGDRKRRSVFPQNMAAVGRGKSFSDDNAFLFRTDASDNAISEHAVVYYKYGRFLQLHIILDAFINRPFVSIKGSLVEEPVYVASAFLTRE